MKVEVESVERIEPEASGKRLIIKRVFPDLSPPPTLRQAQALRQAQDERVLRQAQDEESADGTCELLVRRVAARGGRGRAFVNGALCTVSMLEEALRGMVDISGQHEHVSLLDPRTHLELLDAFALGRDDGPEEALLDRYRAAHAALAALVREREALAAAGRPPLMLLDDVMSELDAARRERLVELLRAGGQAVVAATEPEHVPGAREHELELLFVAGGAVAPGIGAAL